MSDIYKSKLLETIKMIQPMQYISQTRGINMGKMEEAPTDKMENIMDTMDHTKEGIEVNIKENVYIYTKN
jgi:hypothetical protein